LRPAVGMMHAASLGIADVDGGLERGSSWARIDRTVDDVTNDPAGPGIKNDCQEKKLLLIRRLQRDCIFTGIKKG
jgi:hypothetical protein